MELLSPDSCIEDTPTSSLCPFLCHTQTHIDRTVYPLNGFSWVPILRVVCKSMPLLWSATCSRRLPQDLHESGRGEVETPLLIQTCVLTHTHSHNCHQSARWCRLTEQHRRPYSHAVCDGSKKFVIGSRSVPHTHVLSKRKVELPAASYQGEVRITRVDNKGNRISFYVDATQGHLLSSTACSFIFYCDLYFSPSTSTSDFFQWSEVIFCFLYPDLKWKTHATENAVESKATLQLLCKYIYLKRRPEIMLIKSEGDCQLPA